MEERDANGRYVKGHTGNSKGRPRKEYSITSELRRLGKLKDGKLPDGKIIQKYKLLAWSIWEDALKGDKQSREIIINRLEGPIDQIFKHFLSGKDGGEIIVSFPKDFDGV